MRTTECKAATALLGLAIAAHGQAAFAQSSNSAAASLQPTACRQSSYIPSLSPLVLRNGQGTMLALERSVRQGAPTIKVWVNGQFSGEYKVPFTAFGGQIQTRLHQRMGLETWLGRVQQAQKIMPYLVVCGDWSG
jgi:hypothetical protein